MSRIRIGTAISTTAGIAILAPVVHAKSTFAMEEGKPWITDHVKQGSKELNEEGKETQRSGSLPQGRK